MRTDGHKQKAHEQIFMFPKPFVLFRLQLCWFGCAGKGRRGEDAKHPQSALVFLAMRTKNSFSPGIWNEIV